VIAALAERADVACIEGGEKHVSGQDATAGQGRPGDLASPLKVVFGDSKGGPAPGGRCCRPGCRERQQPPEVLARHLHGLAEAGADEAILVLDPITERSVRAIGRTLALLDDGHRTA
jgi:hypothetical protein